MTHHEFPDVVELNVGGVHYTTHLSTLTKHEDSSLAAMFTGRTPVFKDKDGRYFVDADGSLFKNILDYLKTDALPCFDYQPSSFSFGGGGGGGDGLYTDRQIHLFHTEAKQFGLKALSEHIQKHRAAFFEKRLDDYRVSKRGYNECLPKIYNELTLGTLFENPFVIIHLCQDFQTNEENKCCKHNCVGGLEQNGLDDPFCYDDAYRTVKIPFEIDAVLLNCICIDFKRLGFNAVGRIAECQFMCKKAQRNHFGFSLGSNNQCCKKVLYLLQFQNIVQERYVEIYRPQMHMNTNHSKPLFGFPKAFGSHQNLGKPFGGSIFGSNQIQAQNNGTFSFGTKNNTLQSSGFGQNNDNNAQTFSGNQNCTSLFGNPNQNQGQANGGKFGGFGLNQNQEQGFSFASSSGSSTLFGSAQNQSVGISNNVFGSSTGNVGNHSSFGTSGGFGNFPGNPSSGFSFGCSNSNAKTVQMQGTEVETADDKQGNAGSSMANAMDGLKLTADQISRDTGFAANTGNTFGNATSFGQPGFGLKCQKFGSS